MIYLNNLLNNKFFVIYIAPFVLGAITTLSLPPYNFTFINFFSFSTLLFLILVIKKKTQAKFRKKKSNRYYFYLGCSFGFSFFLFGNYWISISLTHDEAFKGLIPFALILIPLFLSLFIGFVTLITGPFCDRKFYFIIFFSLVFSIFEFFRGIILTGFPWNLIAYTWSWSIPSIQILSLIGTYSLSLISITFFCIPFIFFQKKIIKNNLIFLSIFLFFFIFNYLYGVNKINNNSYDYEKSLKVKIVSPNFLLEDYNNKSEENQLEKLIKISNPKKNVKTLFIWPEGIFRESTVQDIHKYKDLFNSKFSKNHLIALGINNQIISNGSENKKIYNSLVIINNELEILSLYNKIKLVPFGEFLPFEKIFSNYGLKKITSGYNSFSAGDNRKIISLGKNFKNKLILPLICYEIIYTGNIKRKNQFSDLIVNISEDAWFGKSIGPYQHFSKAIYRSVEEGVFVARSANKGISAFINPSGKVIKSLNTGESGNIELNFPNFHEKTLFSNYGNKIFYLIIILYMFLILIFRKFRI